MLTMNTVSVTERPQVSPPAVPVASGPMKLYVVRNSQGKYFKPVGYGGYGNQWQDSLAGAKFYAKIGQAKSRCTTFFNLNPKFGCPSIVEFTIDPASGVVIDQTDRAQKSRDKKLAEEAARKEYYRVQTALANANNIKKLMETLSPEQKAELLRNA